MKYDKSLFGILNQADKCEPFHESQMDEVTRFVSFGYLSAVDANQRRYELTDKGKQQHNDLKLLMDICNDAKFQIIDLDGTYG